MYQKLVKLDPKNGWRFSVVDPICVRRAAIALKDYIVRCIDPDDDPYEIRAQVLPLCEGALDGSLDLPLISAELPLTYASREGWLSDSFRHYWSEFVIPATGTPLETTERVTINGEQYAPMYFEEPGDWPDVVEKYENDREARWQQSSKSTPEEIERTRLKAQERQARLAAEERELAERLRQKRMTRSS